MSEKLRVGLNLGVFLVVFGFMLVWAAQNVVSVDRVERPYDLVLYADAASGVGPNAEVAYLGVHYGRVSRVELTDGGVELHLKIDRDREIPVGSTPRIFRKSAIGEPYIDFQPPADFDVDDAEYYEDDDEVLDPNGERLLAAVPLEFSELLRTASELISHIEPEQAASLISELAIALEGRGDDLARFTTSADRLTATFAERTDTLDRLAENNTRLTAVLTEHRGALGSTITDLALLAQSLRASAGDTQVLLDRGTDLLTVSADLIEDARPALDCLLDDLVPVMQAGAEPDRLAGLVRFLQTGPTAYGLLASTVDHEPDGPWVRVNLEVEISNPAPQFVPPLSLPAVQPLVACPGVVTAGNVLIPTSGTPTNFDPTDVLSSGRTPSLPATGAAAAGSVAAVLVLAAWATRRITHAADAAD